MELKNKVVKGVKWTTISTIVVAVCAIIKISVLTRFLDKSDFGLIAMVMFVLGFLELFNDMGISSAILHKKNISLKEYSSLYWFNLFISIILYTFLVFSSPFIAAFYEEPLLVSLISILGLNVIFSGIGRQFRVIEQKKLLFKQVSIIEIIAAIFSLILAIILAIKGYGVYSLIYSSILQFLIANFLFFIIGVKKQKIHYYFNFNKAKPFLKIGLYQVGGQIANYFSRDFDILLIGKFFSPDILGGYSLAKQLVFRPTQILNPILTKVASPSLSLFQDNKALLKKHYLNLVNIVSSINIVVYILLIIFSPIVTRLFYGNDYNDIVILVRILSLYMIFRAIGNPIGSLVVATGRTDLEFYWNLFSLIVMPVFIILGVNYNVVHVAVFLTIAMVVLFIPSWYFLVWKMTGATLKEYINSIYPNYFYNFILSRKNTKK